MDNLSTTYNHIDGMHRWKSSVSFITSFALILGLITLLTAILAGVGTRRGWWSYRTGLMFLRWSGYIGLADILISLVGSLFSGLKGLKGDFVFAFLGLIISLSVVSVLLYWSNKAKNSPPIHDITTDTYNPPQFVAIRPLRQGSPNPSEYGGEDIAKQQYKKYPDIVPLIINVPAEEAYVFALSVAKGMDWEIVDANPDLKRIEATDTTFWFGFKDDIVIIITPKNNSSLIDVRSVSRVGRSDVGTNAERIRKFFKKLINKLD